MLLLGLHLANKTTIDDEISSSFGRLSSSGQKSKIFVFISLLYDCETWITYRRHIKELEQFQQRCIRTICDIKWQDKITNINVMKRCGITSIYRVKLPSHNFAGLDVPEEWMPQDYLKQSSSASWKVERGILADLDYDTMTHCNKILKLVPRGH